MPETSLVNQVSGSRVESNGMGKTSIELVSKSASRTKNNRKSFLYNELDILSDRKRLRKNTFASRKDGENNATNNHFRKIQRSSSGVLIGIVLIFLICNFPRFVVKTFIISSPGKGLQEQFLYCESLNQLHVPVFVHIIGKWFWPQR